MKQIYLILAALILVVLSVAAGYLLALNEKQITAVDSSRQIISMPTLDPIKSPKPPTLSAKQLDDDEGQLQRLDDVLSLPAGFQQYFGAHLLALTLDIDELEGQLSEALAIETKFISYEVSKILLIRYVQVDPCQLPNQA